MEIKINNKVYQVKEVITPEEKQIGLQGVDSLPENEGMLFYFGPNEKASMTMKTVKFPIDIIFIDEFDEVQYVYKGKPGSKKIVSVPNTKYVLEVNAGSGVKIGDEVEFEDDGGPVMKVLYQDGTTQYELYGGERIFRRAFTKQIIRLAKKAQSFENNEIKYNQFCKQLGKKMFKEITAQDNRPPEYVSRN